MVPRFWNDGRTWQHFERVVILRLGDVRDAQFGACQALGSNATSIIRRHAIGRVRTPLGFLDSPSVSKHLCRLTPLADLVIIRIPFDNRCKGSLQSSKELALHQCHRHEICLDNVVDKSSSSSELSRVGIGVLTADYVWHCQCGYTAVVSGRFRTPLAVKWARDTHVPLAHCYITRLGVHTVIRHHPGRSHITGYHQQSPTTSMSSTFNNSNTWCTINQGLANRRSPDHRHLHLKGRPNDRPSRFRPKTATDGVSAALRLSEGESSWLGYQSSEDAAHR
ncbi:hypothetical protein CBL_04259 [Carabus blaptoides fortunei]